MSCDVAALSRFSSYNCLDANNEGIGHHEVTENCSDVDFKEVIMQDRRITRRILSLDLLNQMLVDV